MFANTPKPPYYAVIFTSLLSDNHEGYGDTADRIVELAERQEGFLGIESAREELGITVSYWADLQAIKSWKQNVEHSLARKAGRDRWYSDFRVRICLVERDYCL